MKHLAILFAFAAVTMSGCTTAEECGCVPPPALAEGESCGAASCEEAPPACPEALVPVIDESGCYTGACWSATSCDVPPPCAVLNNEEQCDLRADCSSVFGGINCRDPEGDICTSGEANDCTCEAFVFAACVAA